MENSFKREDAEEIIEKINYPALIKHYTTRNIGLSKLSHNIGESEGHIWKKLKRNTVDIALLFTLSLHLEVNLFEPLLHAMPDNVRKTDVEKRLEEEKKLLEQEIEILKRENELLKSILMK